MALTILQNGPGDGKNVFSVDSLSQNKPNKFPTSRNEEFAEILGKFQKRIELKSDWIISEGLLDALAALIDECENISSRRDQTQKNDASSFKKRREVDVTYFDDETYPKISTHIDELKMYLVHLSSGALEVEGKSSSIFVKSPYHLQKLALEKLRNMFYSEVSEVDAAALSIASRKCVLQIVLHELVRKEVISSDNSSLMFSFFLNDQKIIDVSNEAQMKEIETILTSILNSQTATNFASFFINDLLIEHKFSPFSVDLCERIVISVLSTWCLTSQSEHAFRFLASMKGEISQKLNLSPFYMDFIRENFRSGLTQQNRLIQSVLCDPSCKVQASTVQRVVEGFQPEELAQTASVDQVCQIVMWMCQQVDKQDTLWSTMHKATLATHKHFLQLIMETLLVLVRENFFHEIRSILNKERFRDLKTLLLLLAWNSISGLNNCRSLLTALDIYPPKESSEVRARDDMQHPGLHLRALSVCKQVELIEWCTSFRNDKLTCDYLSTTKLQNCTPLYLIHSTADVNQIPASDIITRLSDPHLYRSHNALSEISRDTETFRSFCALRNALHALILCAKRRASLLADNRNFENKVNKIFVEIKTCLSQIQDPIRIVEVMENLFSLIFLQYSEMPHLYPKRRDHLDEFLHMSGGGGVGGINESVGIDESFNMRVIHEVEHERRVTHSQSVSTTATGANNRPGAINTEDSFVANEPSSCRTYVPRLTEREASKFVANTYFVHSMLHLLRQHVKLITKKSSSSLSADTSRRRREEELDNVLEESAVRFMVVTTKKVDDRLPHLWGELLCKYPERLDIRDIGDVGGEGGTDGVNEPPCCVKQMMGDPISLLFKCLWRKDFEMARFIQKRYEITQSEMESLISLEGDFEELRKEVTDHHGTKEAPAMDIFRGTANQRHEDDDSDGFRRRRRGGAITILDDDEDQNEEPDSESFLKRIEIRARSGISNMNIPQLLEQFFHKHPLPNFASLLSSEAQSEFFKLILEHNYAEMLFKFDIACSCPMHVTLLRTVIEENFGLVSSYLEVNEPKRELGDLGGFQYALVALKDILTTEACEQQSLMNLLANTTLPLESNAYTLSETMLTTQKETRRDLLRRLETTQKELTSDGKDSKGRSVSILSQKPLSTKGGKGAKGQAKIDFMEAAEQAANVRRAENENSMRNKLHTAMQDFLRAFSQPDPMLKNLYQSCGEKEINFLREPPKRVYFLDVFYEYIKIFAQNFILLEGTVGSGDPWTLKCFDGNPLEIKKLSVCPFLLVTHSPTEIICNLVFEKRLQLTAVEVLCEKLHIDLADIICNRLTVSLPWRCLTLNYNAESVMSCANKSLNINPMSAPTPDSVSHISSQMSYEYPSSPSVKSISPNAMLENILDRLLQFLDQHCHNSGKVTGADLLQFSDSYDLEALLEELHMLESNSVLDIKEIKTNRDMFAFFCNLYNLMFIHGAVMEAKAHKTSKDNMGLSCLIGGTPLEKLSFQLRLTYCVGDLKRLSLWQLRNCILRNKKEPVGSVHFGPLLYQVLQAMAKLRLGSSSLMDFSSFDETFLLIDGTSYSPVLQIVKGASLENQMEEGISNWMQKSIRLSKTGLSCPQLLQDHLFDKYGSDFVTINTVKDTNLSSNWPVLLKILPKYLEKEEADQLRELYSKGFQNVYVYSNEEESRKFEIQYEFDVSWPGFEDSFGSNRVTVPGFVDASYLCEKSDRIGCQTYPPQSAEGLKQFLHNKNPMQAVIVNLLHQVTETCYESQETTDRRDLERSMSNRKLTFSLSPATAPTLQRRDPILDSLKLIEDTVSATKRTSKNNALSIWAKSILQPLKDFYQFSAGMDRLDNFLSILSEHGIICGSKCPKVVKKCFMLVDQILKSDVSRYDISRKLELITSIISWDPVNKTRFQPILDMLTCVQSLAQPEKVYSIRDQTLRALFVSDSVEEFTVNEAVEILNCVNRDPDIENQSLRQKVSFQLKEVMLFQELLATFPMVSDGTLPSEWSFARTKFEAGSRADLIDRLCSFDEPNFKLAKQWIQLNPNISAEVREQVEFLSLESLCRKGHIYKFLAYLGSFKCPISKIFVTAQKMIESNDKVSNTIIIVSFLLEKTLTDEDGGWKFSEMQIDLLRNQFLSLLFIKDVSQETQHKYLHIIHDPSLVIQQLLMNCELKALEAAYVKLRNVYTSSTLAESQFLGPKFMQENTLEQLQEAIPHYAKMAVKVDNFLNARNHNMRKQLSELAGNNPDMISYADNTSLNMSIAPGNEDLVSVTGESSVGIGALLADDDSGRNVQRDTSKCYICNSQFGFVMQRKNKCRTCNRFACSRCGDSVEVKGTNTWQWQCDNCITKGKNQLSSDNNGVSRRAASRRERLFENDTFDDNQVTHQPFWKLPRESESAREMINEFFYVAAPSLPLLNSILDLHYSPIEVVGTLCELVTSFSAQLAETASRRSRDRDMASLDNRMAMFEHMILYRSMKKMLARAEEKLQKASEEPSGDNVRRSTLMNAGGGGSGVGGMSRTSNMRRASSVNLSQINFPDVEKQVLELKCAVDVLDMLIAIDYNPLPNIEEMQIPSFRSELIERLVRQEDFKTALDVCQRVGEDARPVNRARGFAALRNGSLIEARDCLKKCLEDKQSVKNEKLVNEIVLELESNCLPPPSHVFNTYDDFFNHMEEEVTSQKPVMIGRSEKRQQCVYYVKKFLPVRYLVLFYAHRRDLRAAVDIFMQEEEDAALLTIEHFATCLFKVVYELGEKYEGYLYIEELLSEMKGREKSVNTWRKYLLPIATSSSSSHYSSRVLYHVHLYLQDYVRCMDDCIDMYRDIEALNYDDLMSKEETVMTNYSNCLAKAIAHAKVNFRMEGNKYLSLGELNECQLKFNLHKDVQAFLSANELQRSATIGSVDEEEKEIKAASGHGGENSLELKKLPKLLTDYSSQLKICCDLYVQFQSGKGFELATKILKLMRLNTEEVGERVARELYESGRFRSMVYLASSLSEDRAASSSSQDGPGGPMSKGSGADRIDAFSDIFLYQCVKCYLEKQENLSKDNQQLHSSEVENAKQLIEKIEDLNSRVDCYVKMGEIRLAYICVAKRGRSGVGQMQELVELAKSGAVDTKGDILPIMQRWLKQNSFSNPTNEE
ncbi:uncharacterized protein LOC142342925 isoform X2 [Convolutriloba macropyga]|uniref:uncharacterized protein LOC142342925 isoform X2 n=1 Tax=Convolutriloba macropyga TaxID=536237 RepID=UPI003F52811A